MAEVFTCSIEACGFSAPADRMWNFDRKVTGGKLVVICGRDARDARGRVLKAYRFSETLRRDAERQAAWERARAAREEFFARFGHARLSDAFKAARSHS